MQMASKLNTELFEQHKEWCLDMIDTIKCRKSRPNFERIAHMLNRSYGLTTDETNECLQSLIEEERVLRVKFKDEISYRKSQNGRSRKSLDSGPQTTSDRIISAITLLNHESGAGVCFENLQAWLISKNPETRLVKNRLEIALKKEIDAKTVIKLEDGSYVLPDISSKSDEDKSSMENIKTEVKVEKEETHNGEVDNATDEIPMRQKHKTPKQQAKEIMCFNGKSSSSAVKTELNEKESGSVKRGRPLSKRKKFKKTHGPDFEESTLQLKRVLSRDGKEDATCGFCSGTAFSNKDGREETLLTCKDCSSRAHPSCMDYSEELANRALHSPWQCMDCKTCCICDCVENEDYNADDLILFCDACDKGYHMSCHKPAVVSKPKGKWVCHRCRLDQKHMAKNGSLSGSRRDSLNPGDVSDEDESVASSVGRKRKASPDGLEVSVKRSRSSASGSSFGKEDLFNTYTDGTVGAPCLPTPCASPRPGDTFDYEMKMSLLGNQFPVSHDNTEYEDASNWSVNEVVQFFRDNGFPDHAYVFEKQEIDGPSLLLMKRNDVLTALNLRLGPALKIYQKVVRIQQCSQSSVLT
ncbi:histone acetyltransferase KAT6B-like [Mya arenaria]|uniref:histone acetyltransferase KAT6B-like n=1 Tax=Mya arenaria TaxID=6604 RepID=UPI0022E017D7|nr:histone acetyltransferase KAT6B-like [Mya arenaria]